MRTLLFTLLISCSLPSLAGWKKFIQIPNLRSIHYINEDLIIALNDTAILWGNQFEVESWQSQKYDFNGYAPMGLTSYFGRKHSAAYFSGLDYGIMLMEKEGQETDRKLYQLTNRAQTLTELILPAEASTKRILDLDFFDEKHGMILLDTTFFVTADGGLNWVKKEIPLQTRETTTVPYSLSLDPIYLHLYPNGNGFIIGFRGIMVTTDYGANWKTWYTDQMSVRNKEFSGQTVPYDAFFENDDIYIMGPYSPYLLNLSGLYKLNPSDTTLTELKSSTDLNNGSIQFQHGIFFSKDNYHFYNNRYYQPGEETGLIPMMFSQESGRFRPSLIANPGDEQLHSYLYDYSWDHTGHLFTDVNGYINIYDNTFCEQVSLESIEQLHESAVRLHINNQSGEDLFYPSAYLSYWDSDTLREAGQTQIYWAAQGEDSYIDIYPSDEKLIPNMTYDVVIANGLNSEFCSYSISSDEVITSKTEPISETGIVLYPNPANNYIQIREMGIESGQVTIINQNGIVVLEKDLTLTDEKMDISNLPKGQYQITVQGTEKRFSGKFIKGN